MGYDYQVAVLGGGPGGYEAAIRCAQYGLKTALIEERDLGGTCLNRGCIPTKAMLHGAEVYGLAKAGSEFGLNTGALSLDYAKLSAWKDRKVLQLRRGVEALERANGVQVLRGRGTLTGAHGMKVGDNGITFDKLILATGSRPARPPIPGIENAVTSDEVLAQTALPESAVIIGGGVIGLEFATLYATLGCKVTILEMLDVILPNADQEIAAIVRGAIERLGVSLETGARVTEILKGAVRYEKAGRAYTASGEQVIVSIGRRPNTEDIGLERIGLVTQKGFLPVDDRCQTRAADVWAIGDITGRIQLAHVASAQGLTAAANCAGKNAVMRYDRVPSCVYTAPEVAWVGMTEAQAREKGRSLRIGKFPVSGNGRCLVMNESDGFAKIVSDENTGEILGCQIASPRATDLISEICAVMACEGTVEEIAAAIHPHPTVSEMLMEAAHDTEGLSCHAMPKKRTKN